MGGYTGNGGHGMPCPYILRRTRVGPFAVLGVLCASVAMIVAVSR